MLALAIASLCATICSSTCSSARESFSNCALSSPTRPSNCELSNDCAVISVMKSPMRFFSAGSWASYCSLSLRPSALSSSTGLTSSIRAASSAPAFLSSAMPALRSPLVEADSRPICALLA